jgi:hypothetical protein
LRFNRVADVRRKERTGAAWRAGPSASPYFSGRYRWPDSHRPLRRWRRASRPRCHRWRAGVAIFCVSGRGRRGFGGHAGAGLGPVVSPRSESVTPFLQRDGEAMVEPPEEGWLDSCRVSVPRDDEWFNACWDPVLAHPLSPGLCVRFCFVECFQ